MDSTPAYPFHIPPAGDEAPETGVPLLFDTCLIRSTDGYVYLGYDGYCYSPQDRLPDRLSNRWPYGTLNARQFVAHCMLLNRGSDAKKWPTFARIFTEIY